MVNRAQRTALAVRFSPDRRRPRKRLPRQNIPRGIERDYARTLVRLVRSFRSELDPLFAELPGIVSGVRESRARLDAGEINRVRQLIESIVGSTSVNTSAAEALAATFADRVSTHQRVQLSKQLRAGLGVDVFAGDQGLLPIIEGFTAENVALIKSLPSQALAEIEGVVLRGVTSGELHGNIAKQIRERVSVAENRAKVIARDQVGKFYGQVQRQRQQTIGIRRFIWRDVGDRRVRSSHVSISGQVFDWESGAPGEGFPGQPTLCRCFAEPMLDEILGEV